MRISGGRARGIPLVVPRGDVVRPATDAMRQAVFSCLGGRIVDAVFLDLYAGSGAYGLEALSRGARHGWFVDKNAKALGCLRKNIAAVCRSAQVSEQSGIVLPIEVESAAIWQAVTAVNIVFIDPPYDLVGEIAPRLLSTLAEQLSEKDPLVIFEHPGEVAFSHEKWIVRKELGGGSVRQPAVTIFGRSENF